MRPARRQIPGRDHVRARPDAERRPPRDLPRARHAPGRPGLLRGGSARPRPGRHVRRPPGQARRGRPGHAVRRPRLRPGRPPVPARHRHLLVRLGRRQARRVRQRHAALVGARRPDQAGRALPRVVRQPAQVRPDGPPGQLRHARAHRADRHWPGRNNTLPGGPVRAGRRHHHRRLRRAGRGRRAAGHPARPGRAHGGHRVQRPQRRPARRARRDRRSACRCAARPKRPPRCRPQPSAKPWSSSPRTTRCTPSSRSCCPPAPPATWRRRSGRRPPENHSPPSC